MKKLALALLTTGILLSCSKADEPTPSEGELCSQKFELEQETFPKAWKLVKMTGSIINSETVGADMPWQESIILRADNTFFKQRVRNNITSEASGTYVIETSLGGDPAYIGLILSYSSESELIGSCQSKALQETYILESKCKLVGTWNACDGPGLEYTRQVMIVD